jgi:hypothetical protein
MVIVPFVHGDSDSGTFDDEEFLGTVFFEGGIVGLVVPEFGFAVFELEVEPSDVGSGRGGELTARQRTRPTDFCAYRGMNRSWR